MTKRIIACLDVDKGRVVKGVKFEGLKDKGDPVELSSLYEEEGADEITFLDITATVEGRETVYEVVKNTAYAISIPLTVGGGIRTVEDVSKMLKYGADKVSINTSAVLNKQLVTHASREFGAQAIVVAIDVKREGDRFVVYTHAGRARTELEAVGWAREVETLGAGEILLTSIDMDGTREGYDIQLIREVTGSVKIPVIASGGAGRKEHFYDVFSQTGVDAALAAGVFHDRVISIKELKSFLAEKGIEVRT